MSNNTWITFVFAPVAARSIKYCNKSILYTPVIDFLDNTGVQTVT